MHPAFSVIFFTTASGAGFGLLAWLGLLAMCDRLPGRVPAEFGLLLGAVLATAGLCSSVLHLGQPLRAWRAFSQWRSSWLSREGIVALVTFVPLVFLLVSIAQAPLGHYTGHPGRLFSLSEVPVVASSAMRIAGGLLLALSIATVACTAMIYVSLKPIPAWRHPLVLPVYLAFSAFTGGLIHVAIGAFAGYRYESGPLIVAVLGGALFLAVLKWRAWRFVDEGRVPVSRNSALGLPHERPVRVFERPHTEANYLLKEMGYVLARKHARRLRWIAALFFSLVPVLLVLPLWLLPHLRGAGPLLAIASCSALLGALVKRWFVLPPNPPPRSA